MNERARAERRVLLVDDSRLDTQLGRAVLERAGYEVSEAHDAATALARAAQERFDLILLDLHLPDRGGMEVMRELRARESGRPVRIFALTAGSVGLDTTVCIAAGFDACLSKPLRWRALSGILAEAEAPVEATPAGLADVRERGALTVDRARLLQLAGGNRSLVAELEQAFVQDAPPLCDRLSAAMAGAALPQAEAAAHALKGLLLNLCATPAAERARALERLLSQGQLEAAGREAQRLVREVEEIRKQLLAAAESP